jgi:cytochrome P450
LTPHTLFAETDNALHQKRRKTLDPAFSKRAVNQLEPVIGDKINLLAKKIKASEAGEPVNIYNAFR